VGQYISYLQSSEKLMNEVTGDVLYNILTEFIIPGELVRLITMCLNETYD
jgi:hypothetical protein